jgi:hypothetical protein
MKVFIASFGSKDVIRNVLALHGLRVDDVYTSGRYDGYEDGEGMDDKNEMILDACETHHLSKPFLIDDSKTNIDRIPIIKDSGSYHVKGKAGLTLEDAKEILALLSDYDSVFIDADLTLFRDHVTSELLYPWQEAGKSASSLDVTKIVLAEGARSLLNRLSPDKPWNVC